MNPNPIPNEIKIGRKFIQYGQISSSHN